MTAFKKIVEQRCEELAGEFLTRTVSQFLMIYDDAGVSYYQEHLKYELGMFP